MSEGMEERGPPGQPHDPWADPGADPVRQPLLNLPWPVSVLVVGLVGFYVLETVTGGADHAAGLFGFAPAALTQGGWFQLVTALFVHGSWGHVLTNAAFALAFCAPVARRFGASAPGALLFLLYFLACGVIGNLGFALVHPNTGDLVGASGAIAGFMGGTSRLMWRGPGLAPFTSPVVLVMAASILGLNLAVGLLHLDIAPGSDGSPIAWEAHVAGYLAGLFLIGPFVLAAPKPGSKQRLQRSKD